MANWIRFGFAALVCLVPVAVVAQPSYQSAAGQTVLNGRWDPARVVTRNPEPITPAPGQVLHLPPHKILPLDEYERRKSSIAPRNPASIQPPRVAYANEGIAASAPQVTARQPLANTASVQFPGAGQGLYQPPDPDIAVGPEDILMVVNSALVRMNKEGQVTDSVIFAQWFNASNLLNTVCPSGTFNCLLFDPKVHYDQVHGRFLMSMMARDFPGQKSHLLISVSDGATYASGWKNWAFDARLDGTTVTNNWADFPQLGFDDKAVYLTANMFDFTTNTFQYSKVRVFRKTELYNPATVTLNYKDFFNLRHEDTMIASSLQPARIRGRVGTVPVPGIIVGASDKTSADYLTIWKIEAQETATPTISRVTVKGVWAYDYPQRVPQLGTTITLDPGDSRVLRAVIREGILYVAQNAGYADEPATVTYTRIDLAAAVPKVTTQARLINGYFMFPAFDIPPTIFTTDNIFPNKLIAGTTTKPDGTLGYAGLREVKEGEDLFDTSSNGTTARWGDYNGGAIDPVQGGLWVGGQYARKRQAGASVFGNWIAYFPWSTVPTFTDVPVTHPNHDEANLMKLWGITKGCGDAIYCPDWTATRAQAAVFIIRALYGENFTFPPTPYFTDVPNTLPEFKYIQKLRELNITKGCGATTYCPEQTLPRRAIAVFIVRAKMNALFANDGYTAPTQPFFVDVPATDPDFKHIQKLRDLGITRGCSSNGFCPEMLVTRGQLADLIIRAFVN